jgi:hypothetical protein
MTSKLFQLGIDVLAARRITRFVVEDKLAEDFREAKFFHKHEKLQYLVNCPYCVGIYASAAVVISSMLVPKVANPVKYALALAEVNATAKDLEAQREALVENYGPPL